MRVRPADLSPGSGAQDGHDSAAHRLRAELAIEAAGIGSFDYDLIAGTLSWDDRLIDLFGYERDAFAGTIDAFFARLHPEDVERTGEAMRTTIETRGDLDVEYRVVLPGGETRWVQGRGRVLVDADGTPVRLIGAAYDTTRQRHGDARVARVLETMTAAFLSLDREWCFSYVNAEAERMLRRSREELLGGSIWELFPAAVGTAFEEHYRAAADSGELRTFEAHYPAPLDAWYEIRAYPGPDGLSVYFVEVTERKVAEQRAARSAARLALIAEVADALSSDLMTPGAEEIALQRIAEAVVPLLGDWSVASFADEDGRLRDVGSWHRDPALRSVTRRYAELRLASLKTTAPLVLALTSGQVTVVPDVQTALVETLDGEVRRLLEELAPRTALAVPLVARSQVHGALSIPRGVDRPSPDDEDVATARDIATRIAMALDNARLGHQQRRIAERLQRSLLTDPPVLDGVEVVVRYDPALEAAEVGGDWYDAFVQPDGATMLVIGDVVGHDAEAAAAMGQLRGLLRGIAYRPGAGPVDVLSGLDAAMRGLGVTAMATGAIVRLEQTADERAVGMMRLRWSNAGHPPPLVLHADGRIEQLAGQRPELMLGVDPTAARSEQVTQVRSGSTVLLYTDGLVEGPDLPYDDGIAALTAALAGTAGRPLIQLCDDLVDRVRPGRLQDDVALVAVRIS